MNPGLVRKIKILGNILFYLYIAFVGYFLFFSEMMGRTPGESYRYNFELFSEINRYFGHMDSFSLDQFALNMFGNVLLFVPVGFFLPMLYRAARKFFVVLLWSCVISLLIETIQLVTKVGIFDVDDIFLNTLGGIFGYILYSICMAIYRRVFKEALKAQAKEKEDKNQNKKAEYITEEKQA